MRKLNCWEFMECGREVGGKHAEELGICIAALEKKANGINGGLNAGRCCWAVAGTFCGGKAEGTFVEQFVRCMGCPFYKKIAAEEYKYMTLIEIRKIINGNI